MILFSYKILFKFPGYNNALCHGHNMMQRVIFVKNIFYFCQKNLIFFVKKIV